MFKLSKNIYIVAAKRTAFGSFGGKLKDFTATELGGFAAVGAMKQLPKGTPVDSVVFGNVLQTSADAAYLSRHVGHRAGLDIKTPALTLNRLCGSGFQAAISGAQEILTEEAEIVLTGGTESMSQAPYALRNARFGTRYGVDQKLEDTLAHGLVDSYPQKIPMGITAENLAERYKITRHMSDEFAMLSQQRTAKAQESGYFNAEIVPVEIKSRKGAESFAKDEYNRPQTTIEALGKLPTVFKKDGVVTPGSASGICDGAAAVIVASEQAVKKHNLKPLAKILSWHYCGVDPSVMGIGPVYAIPAALKRAGLELKDMDRIEVNEAFAAQYLSVEKELGLPRDKTNVNGGAIAIGHPLGASGSRILAHLTYELARINGKYAIGSACIGGGQGIAVVIERC